MIELRNEITDTIGEFINNISTKLYICIFDVTDFRFINYMYGYDFGNTLLDKIVIELSAYFSEKCHVSRFAGDKILVIIPMNEDDCNNRIIENILNQINIKLNIDNKSTLINFKTGISIYPYDSKEIKECVKFAEIALSYSKRRSKNKYEFFKNFMYKELIRKLKMYSFLDNALDNNEFVVYYQPQVDISKMKVFGVEALIRWNSHKYGMVSPSEFIDRLEQTEKINDISKFIIYEACKEIKKLNELGNNLCVSINITARQLQNSKFSEFMCNMLKEIDLSAEHVCLEITERSLVEYEEKIVDNLIKLNELGIKLYIDDFGIKYSSLNYLRQFTIDGIKIDKSFVDEVHTSTKQFTITKNIIELSQRLNIDVIAEGIESKEQLECLKKANCCKIQGYLFSKPICSNDLIEFINKFNTL